VRIEFPSMCEVQVIKQVSAEYYMWWCGAWRELNSLGKFKQKSNLKRLERLKRSEERRVGKWVMCVCGLLISLVYASNLPSSIRQVSHRNRKGHRRNVKLERTAYVSDGI